MTVKIDDPLPIRFATREAAIRAQENFPDLSEMVPRGTKEWHDARYEMALVREIPDGSPIPAGFVKVEIKYE